MKKNLLIFFLGAAVIIALDQITKSAITSRFVLHESYPVIDGLFNLVYVLNPGAAFGFLADASKSMNTIESVLLIQQSDLRRTMENLGAVVDNLSKFSRILVEDPSMLITGKKEKK